MKTFKVYKHPIKGFEVVKDGFSWPAFFFGILWMLISKLWGLACLWIIIYIGLSFVEIVVEDAPESIEQAVVFLILIAGYLVWWLMPAFKGNSWRDNNLLKRGYEPQGIVQAETKDAAIVKAVKTKITPLVTPQFIESDKIKHLVDNDSSHNVNKVLLNPNKRSYFSLHWHGELTLPVSYWINGFFVSIIFVVIMMVIPWGDFVNKSPKLYSIGIIFLWFLLVITSIWQSVGIWRSANRYLSQGKSKVWGTLAQIAVILGLLRTVVDFISVGLPQISEYGMIVAGKDPVGSYQLRVLRDATELEISGSIAFGLTDEVSRILDAHPTIHIIHLNSDGGRVSEARNLRDLIDLMELTTFTASGCYSACTLAYAAGQKRLIATDANLGFHQYSFPGVEEQEFHSEYEKDRQDWLARGVDKNFIDKVFNTPNDKMWYPTHYELIEAGIITGYPESNDVAISGYKLSSLEDIESEFSNIPLFMAIKIHEPHIYNKILSEIRTAIQKGRSKAEIRIKILPLMQSIYMQKLPYASNSALRSFTELMLEQMQVLYSTDPALCYEYIYRQEQNNSIDITSYFSEELQQKELLIMAEVINSAATKATQPPKEEEIQNQLASVFAILEKKHRDDIQILVNPEIGNTNMTKACELTYDLYQAILELSEHESASILRFMFSSE